MYTLYKFHFLNGISEINQLFDDYSNYMTSTCMYIFNNFMEKCFMVGDRWDNVDLN